jgi:formylglycine-generating enzyme required for sulfatase activity
MPLQNDNDWDRAGKILSILLQLTSKDERHSFAESILGPVPMGQSYYADMVQIAGLKTFSDRWNASLKQTNEPTITRKYLEQLLYYSVNVADKAWLRQKLGLGVVPVDEGPHVVDPPVNDPMNQANYRGQNNRNKQGLLVNEGSFFNFTKFRDLPHENCPELIVIPAGKFLMGASHDDDLAYDDEKPQHEVVLGNRFAIGRYLITFAEFSTFCLKASRNIPEIVEGCCERCPATNISWDEAVEYVNWLSEVTSKIYRLPTEAEWEYCCRAGTTSRFCFGSQITTKHVNFDNKSAKPNPVGSLIPNPWGIYDMHGNVWEYVADSWHENYENAPVDGSAWVDGAKDVDSRVVRGGGFYCPAQDNRSSVRCYVPRHFKDDKHGFRVVRSL